MKKLLALVLCMILMAAVLSGCSSNQESSEQAEDEVLTVYAAFYPIYALADMIVQDVPGLSLNCLVQPQDGCLRDYMLSDWDLSLLANAADTVLIGGRGLENFENLLYNLGEDGPGVTALMYNMELDSFNDATKDDESHWSGENPHIYMKTDGALALAERIAGSMRLMDAENSDIYEKNLAAAQAQLVALKAELQRETAHLKGKPVIVMNEALLYTAEEHSLEIEGVICRESGEALYDKALENCLKTLAGLQTKVILIEKQAPEAFCRTLEAAGYALARLDVLSTRTASDGGEGYFESMRANTAAICDAFAAAEEKK